MAGRYRRVVLRCGALLREIGSGMRGVMPPMRSPDGTFGTQRMQSEARAADRRRDYPS